MGLRGFNPTSGPDIIPRLYDASLNGMAQLGMNINGVEEVDGVWCTQSWWCRGMMAGIAQAWLDGRPVLDRFSTQGRLGKRQ